MAKQNASDDWKNEPLMGHREDQLGLLGLPLPKQPDHFATVMALLSAGPKIVPKAKQMARAVAAQGRGGDTEIAHLTPGEMVIPKRLQTPEVLAALKRAAGGAIDRYTVGHPRNSVNPKTGAPEFDDDSDKIGGGYADEGPSDGASGDFTSYGDQGNSGEGSAANSDSPSDGSSPSGGADPVEEITVTGKPIAKGSDVDLLARAIAGEAGGESRIPNAMEAVGSALRNRMGQPGFKGGTDTLADVLNHDQVNAVGTQRWNQTGDPSTLKGDEAAAYARALQVAEGIFNGTITDPTGGAMYYYSGDSQPPFFQHAVAAGTIVPAAQFGPFSFFKNNPALK